MRILVVEDNIDLANALKSALLHAEYAVDMISDGAQADHLIQLQEYDLVILDLGLPKLDGYAVLSNMRKRNIKTPVLILTARKTVDEKITGLDLGADDYMTKPFDLEELLARIRAMLRRGANENTPVVIHGRLTYDTVSRQVTIDEQSVNLTARELNLLGILLKRVGKVVSKQQLAEHLFSFDDEANDNAIEVYISRIRKKIPDDIFKIHTVRGLGYLVRPAE